MQKEIETALGRSDPERQGRDGQTVKVDYDLSHDALRFTPTAGATLGTSG